MLAPPEFLRAIVDGAFEAALVVLSNGIIWHMNESSHQMFCVHNDSRSDAPAHVSTYLSFSKPRATNMSWEDLIAGEYFPVNKYTTAGIGMPKSGGSFPLTINVVRVPRSDEETEGYEKIGHRHNDCYYFVYIKDVEREFLSELKNQINITRGILDASFDALFVINEQGIIQQVNETSARVFGWSRGEFLGQNISMIMPAGVAEHHNQYLGNYLRTGIKKMMGTQRETTAQRKDKSTFPCVLGLSQIEDSPLFCGFIRDLTVEKAAQSASVQNEQYMKTIIDASFDALFVINDRGIIQKVNDASEKVFGWNKEELINQNINIIMPGAHARKHDSYLDNYARSGIKKMIGTQREVEARKKDGTLFPCILGLSELRNGDGKRHYVGFIRDVTLQKSLLIAQAEREASDNLLHNILPEHIAQRLKQDPSNIADHFDNTTILFADIVGFTDRTSTMSPRDVVTLLNDLFSRFDLLVGTYDLNKVKTIGDCYMVTSIPNSDLEHDGCARVCHFALDLLKSVRKYNCLGSHEQIELRVGIATGQVVAGEDVKSCVKVVP